MTLLLALGLYFFETQKPLGSLEQAAPRFWQVLTQKESLETEPSWVLQDFLSDSLAKRFPKQELRDHFSKLLNSENNLQPFYLSHYKRGVSKDGDAVAYFQTPQFLVQTHWSRHQQWFTSNQWYRLRWKLNNMCILDEAVARTSQKFVSRLLSSSDRAYEMTLDHALPRRQVQWITPALLTQWRQDLQQQPSDLPALQIDTPVQFEQFLFVSQQRWKGVPVQVSFTGNGYGKQGCRLRLAKIETKP